MLFPSNYNNRNPVMCDWHTPDTTKKTNQTSRAAGGRTGDMQTRNEPY